MAVLRLGTVYIGPHPSAAVREPEPPEPYDAAGQVGLLERRLLLRGTCFLQIHSGQGLPLPLHATLPSPPAPQGHYAILYTCNARPWTWQCAFGGPRPLPGVWRFRRTAA